MLGINSMRRELIQCPTQNYGNLIHLKLNSEFRICDYPNVDFMVILNPHNGPGEPILPDENYTREIPRLNALPNVCTIGYVRVNYCKRDLTEVCHDVAKYSRWEKESKISGLAVHGIFIDETPNLYDDEKARYLDTLGRYVKDTSGILGDRTVSKPGSHYSQIALLITGVFF